jgi:hypothetical protein
MSTSITLVLNIANSLADTKESILTTVTTGPGTMIDSVTASNATGVNASYSAYIVAPGETPTFPQTSDQVVVWGENELGIGLVNHVIPPGGSLYIETSAANSIYFTVSGRILDS